MIAGDIYDRSVPPTTAIELIDDVLTRICQQLHTPVIMIHGNHDGAKRLGFAAQHMQSSGLHIISDFTQMLQPVVLSSEQAGEVAFTVCLTAILSRFVMRLKIRSALMIRRINFFVSRSSIRSILPSVMSCLVTVLSMAQVLQIQSDRCRLVVQTVLIISTFTL